MNATEFQAEIRRHAKPVQVSSRRDVVNDFLATKRKTFAAMKTLGLGEQGRKEAKQKLLEGFYARWLGRLWPTLDTSFLTGTRKAVAVRDSSSVRFERFGYAEEEVSDPMLEAVVTLPVFVKVEPRGGEAKLTACVSRVGAFERGRRANQSYRFAEIDAHTACPDGFGVRHWNLFRRFQAEAVAGHSRLVRHGVVPGPGAYSRYQENIPACNLSVAWAPLDENWVAVARAVVIPRADPAVIAECMGRYYLLDFFDTPDERPIGNVIREFTDGKH